MNNALTFLVDALPYIGWAVAVFAAFIFFAISPLLPWFYLRKLKGHVPKNHIKGLKKSMIQAWLKNLLTMPADVTAPIVVPIALIFTKWNAEHLPKLFRWWDNEVSINGDWGFVPLDKKSQEAINMAYYAKGHHPRSFYARWVWLGLRNRATWAAWALGYRKKAGDTEDEWSYGDVWGGKGWLVARCGPAYRLRYHKALSKKRFLRIHFGYKIGGSQSITHGNVVAIGFSIRKRK